MCTILSDWWRKPDDREDYLAPSILGSLVFGGGIGLAVAFMLPAQAEETITKSYSLESIQDNNGARGSMFLGCGVIESRMTYVFYYDDGGAYKMGMADYTKASIVYSDSSPRIEYIGKKRVKGKIINYFALDCMCSNSVVFYIPRGSITNDYKLDAQ